MGVFQRGNKWYARWRDQGGKLVRRSLGDGIRTKTQAETVWRKLLQARTEKKLGILDPSLVTLGGFRDEYLAHRAPLNLSPHTKRQDEKAFKSLISVVGEHCLLRSINQKIIDSWAGILLQAKRSPRSINSYLSHIIAALNTAVAWGYINKMPQINKLKTPNHLPRALSPTEVDRLLNGEKNTERRALWLFLVWTGLRRQEALNLTWQDINITSETPWMRVIGKGDKERLVPLLPEAVKALGQPKQIGPVWIFTPPQKKGRPRPPKDQLQYYKDNGMSNVAIAKLYGVSDSAIGKWLRTPEPAPAKVHPDTISKWLKAAIKRAGIRDARLHDLRHTAATWMAARGVSEHVIQEIMGHASILTTQIYTKGMAGMANLYEAMRKGLDEK